MATTYSWRLPGLSKKVDPDVAMKELDRIKSVFGSLTPEIIVVNAQNEDSPLHALFEWNNDEAARKYRIIQARTILNNIDVKVVHNGEEKNISVFEVVSNDGNNYKSIDTFDESDIEQIKFRIKNDLTSIKNKLSFYKDFSKVIVKIDEVIDDLD